MLKWLLKYGLYPLVIVSSSLYGSTDNLPQNIDELKTELNQLLAQSHTPGMAVALVEDGQISLSEGFGIAHVATNTPATGDTLFRIGSVSKAFVAFAALQLQSQGKLDLNAPLRSVAPEIEFENPWEDTDPVRLIHLLEHTAGFEDMHLRDLANQDARPNNLREALTFDPDSRVSRWQPGTHMAYANSGPAIVAYVVEQVVGMPFEDYVEQQFFEPIGMQSATFFEPDSGTPFAHQYREDGDTAFNYWHISVRPAGSINASANDMARYVLMHVNRGSVDGNQVIPSAQFEAIEYPETWIGTRAGLKTGYGKYNAMFFDEAGRAWHGHNGGMQGALADFSYHLAANAGYAIMINSGDGVLLNKVRALLHKYLTRKLPERQMPPGVSVSEAVAEKFAGFYLLASPRNEWSKAVGKILNPFFIQFQADTLLIGHPLWGEKSTFVATDTHIFRRDDRSVANLALIEQGPSGDTMVISSFATLKKTNIVNALGPFLLLVLTLLTTLVSLLFTVVWSIRAKWGKLSISASKHLRVWPLCSSLAMCLFAIALVVFATDELLLEHYAGITPYSVFLFSASVIAGLVAIMAVIMVLKGGRSGANSLVYGLALLTVFSHTSLVMWLVWQGAIPLITWG